MIWTKFLTCRTWPTFKVFSQKEAYYKTYSLACNTLLFLFLFHTCLSFPLAPISASYSPPRGSMSSGHRKETMHGYEEQPEQVTGEQDPASHFVTDTCSGLCQIMSHFCASASLLWPGYKMPIFLESSSLQAILYRMHTHTGHHGLCMLLHLSLKQWQSLQVKEKNVSGYTPSSPMGDHLMSGAVQLSPQIPEQ